MEKVLKFYSKFSEYELIGNSAFSVNTNRKLRNIKASDLLIDHTGIKIKVTGQMASYIKNQLSPVIHNKTEKGDLKDINRLLISLVFTKVYFKENDESLYFPLISVDLTDKKEQIFSALRSGITEIFIPWNSELVLNEMVISSFFNIKYEENGKEKDEYISNKLEELVYFENGEYTIQNVMKALYSMFKQTKHEEFDLLFPEIKSENSTVLMFFNQKEDLKYIKQFCIENSSYLLQEYLSYTQEENKAPDFNSDKIWIGALTKDYPLGKGQSIVMQQNTKDSNRIISVEGAPGTGKTTLFLSIIAQEVTKRAVKLAKGEEDSHNLMLITSTSNKAVENVFTSLKHGFKNGFVYVGGNSSNKKTSAIEAQQYIESIADKEFSSEKQEKAKKNILHSIELFEEKKEKFKKIKSLNLPFKTLEELNDFVEKRQNQTSKIGEGNIFRISKILNNGNVFDILEKIVKSEEFNYYVEESTKGGFLSKVFGNSKALKSFNTEFSLDLNYSDFQEVMKVLKNLNIEDINNARESKLLEKSKKALDIVNEKMFKGFQKYDNFAEYFRTNLFSMNYTLYINALRYMEEEVLKHKSEVIKAIGYFTADNKYKYIVSNYGYKQEKHEEFLRFLSMAYPVTSSTLAAVNGMFSEMKCKPFNLILADEAGMIPVNTLIPALNRGERAIIVGDPKQLEPIVSVREIFLANLRNNVTQEFWDKYSPTSVSAYHRASGTINGSFKSTGRGIVLDEHRRCAPKIANLFIDIAEYNGLNVRTFVNKNDEKLKKVGDNLMFFHTKNVDQDSYKKINFSEINKIEVILKRLEAVGYDLKKDIGIITPYRDQEYQLISKFGSLLNHSNEQAKIGTVHKFQGVEYKVVIFSSVISREHDSLSFVNSSPSLINVSISRAKDCFFVVGDYNKLTEDPSYNNYIGRMSKYIAKNGKLIGMS